VLPVGIYSIPRRALGSELARYSSVHAAAIVLSFVWAYDGEQAIQLAFLQSVLGMLVTSDFKS